MSDLEYEVYSKYRTDIIRRIRDQRRLQGAPVEDRIYLGARSKEERKAVSEYLNK